ncbi:hypothetical protein [Streptomyces clavifer]|uniref:hypothetical protein n=1 Tax=Streptomyces clavifer TaxID=68188 RepID=UPI0037F9BCCE
MSDPEEALVLGTLLDRVGDVVRLTVPVLVTRWSGVPHQLEEAIGSWTFWPLPSLHQPLFVPSAQCLTSWDQTLPLDHPPAGSSGTAPRWAPGPAVLAAESDRKASRRRLGIPRATPPPRRRPAAICRPPADCVTVYAPANQYIGLDEEAVNP